MYIVILCTATRIQSQFSEFWKQLTMVPHLFSIQYPSKACFCNKYFPNAENDLWIDTFLKKIFKIQSVQSLSCVQLFETPRTATRQASLSITNSQSLLKRMPIMLVMPPNHLILCCPLLLPPSIFPSIRFFSNESVLHIRWPKYWSFSFSISASNEH